MGTDTMEVVRMLMAVVKVTRKEMKRMLVEGGRGGRGGNVRESEGRMGQRQLRRYLEFRGELRMEVIVERHRDSYHHFLLVLLKGEEGQRRLQVLGPMEEPPLSRQRRMIWCSAETHTCSIFSRHIWFFVLFS
jgi:hypothetical protein